MIFKNRKEEYIFLFKKGLKDLDIAQILGVSESFVAKARNKYFKSGDSVCKKNLFPATWQKKALLKCLLMRTILTI